MSKANADIKYDPELPFVVAIENYSEDYVILGRCSTRQYAEDLVRNGTILRKIIDTTPKPKIPEDAEFIYYISWSNSGAYARRVGHAANNVWETSNPISHVDEEDLLKTIGDAEVTVLVRKEET